MWQDLWEIGQDKDVTVYHVMGHVPLVIAGNDKADALLYVRWLEKAPVTDGHTYSTDNCSTWVLKLCGQ